MLKAMHTTVVIVEALSASVVAFGFYGFFKT